MQGTILNAPGDVRYEERPTDDLAGIEAAAAAIQVQGGRYPEHLEKMANL